MLNLFFLIFFQDLGCNVLWLNAEMLNALEFALDFVLLENCNVIVRFWWCAPTTHRSLENFETLAKCLRHVHHHGARHSRVCGAQKDEVHQLGIVMACDHYETVGHWIQRGHDVGHVQNSFWGGRFELV